MRKLQLLLSLLLLVQAAGAQQALPEAVNSPHPEYSAQIDRSGRDLYFTRSGDPRNRGANDAADIWMARLQPNGSWAQAVKPGAPVNSTSVEHFAGLSTSGDRLYVFRPGEGALVAYAREGRFWGKAEPQAVEGMESLSGAGSVMAYPDEGLLLLALPAADSSGQQDLYFSLMQGAGQWSRPEALPGTINSPYDEATAVLAADQRTLYFASARPAGQGGYDLYHSRRKGKSWRQWAPARPLSAGINSEADEHSLSVPASGARAYFIRVAATDSANIWTSTLAAEEQPMPVTLLRGKVILPGGDEAAFAKIYLEGVAEGQHSLLTQADYRGHFQAVLPSGMQGSFFVRLPGYFPISFPVLPQPTDRATRFRRSEVRSSVVYQQRDQEIEALQRYDQQLQERIRQLNRERQQVAQSARSARPVSLRFDEQPQMQALRKKYDYFVLETEQYLSDAVDGAEEEAPAADSSGYIRFRRIYLSPQARREAQRETASRKWKNAPTFTELQQEAQQELERELQAVLEQEARRRAGIAGLLRQERPGISPADTAALLTRSRALLATRPPEAEASTAYSPGKRWAAKGAPAKAPLWERRLKASLKEAMRDEVEAWLRENQKDIFTELAALNAQHQQLLALQQAARKMAREKMLQQAALEQSGGLSRREEPPAAPALSAPEAAAYQEISKTLELVPTEAGRRIPLNKVNFAPNEAVLLPASYAELKHLLAFLQEHESLKIEVQASVAGAVSHATALSLTKMRAEAVRGYLVANGVPDSRVDARGLGKRLPVSAQQPAIEQQLYFYITEK